MSARVVLLVTLLAMGAALLLTAESSRRAVNRATDTIVRGQAEIFAQATRERIRESETGPAGVDLTAFLEAEEPLGLRFVALLDRDGEVIASAGTASRSVETGRPAAPGFSVESAGDRVRVVFTPPPAGERGGRLRPRDRPGLRGDGRRPRRDDGPPPPRPGDRDPRLGPPRRPGLPPSGGPAAGPGPPERDEPDLLLEFEPLVAAELERQATRTLILGAAAAIALSAAAFASWRLLSRRERDERRLAEQRRLASLGEMSAVLAHEIRNPLASLKGHAQLLAERLPAEGDERRGAERVITEAKRLEKLASSLLDFVRTASVATEPCDPVELMSECAEAVGEGRVDVVSSRAPTTWSLDPLRVRQVLRNLIENAVQASPPEARVEVHCRTRGARLVFEVLDRGNGLPAAGAEQLFEPFHTTRTTGTGLGLAVARRVVELHGGTIEARDRPGGGAIFRVELPGSGKEA